MPITKPDVLEVVRDLRLRNIRFSVGPINVNSEEYDKVSDYIESGAIKVVPGKGNFSIYYPQVNTLRTREGNPLQANVRSNLLHECTHIICDINKYKVTRLTDEAAAYLAEIAYLFLLMPSLPEPQLGPPLNNMMRLGMELVKRYRLGEPAGQGATIAASDVSAFEKAVHAIPDYSHIDPNEKLAADGVALRSGTKWHPFNSQAEVFFRLQLQRFSSQLLNDLIWKELTEQLRPKVRGVSYENYVTWDPELLTLFDMHKRGGDSQKRTALQKLLHIFLTIDQRSAARLLQRLSTLRKGDVVSERFQSGFEPDVKAALLSALEFTR